MTNLLERLKKNQLDIPCAAGSTAATEPHPLRESERRRVEYQEAVADCMQMKQNVKLLAEKDNLSFHECLKKFELKDLWQTIRDRFNAAKEELAEIQHLKGMAV